MEGVGAAVGIAAAGALGIYVLVFGCKASARIGGQFFPKGSTKETFGSLLSVAVVLLFFALGIGFSSSIGLLGSSVGDPTVLNVVQVLFGYGLAFGAAYMAGRGLESLMRARFGEPLQSNSKRRDK